MRRLFILWSIALLCVACNTNDAAYTQRIMQHRAAVNYRFLDQRSSPLPPDKLASFKGLSYYEPDKSYLVEAVFSPAVKMEIFGMPHTLNRTYNYSEAGTVTFKLNGSNLQLMAFLSEGQGRDADSVELLIPFTDLTSGKETYGGGRYLDVKTSLRAQKVMLDFNMAYNPYCAYNKEYSCPIPPKQNHLPVVVEAGEKYSAH